jgi:hypothetical protein
MSEPRTSSEEQNLHHLHRGVTRTRNPTGIARRGPVRRSTLPDHLSLMPEGHPVKAIRHWTTSSTPSAHTTKTYATPCGTIGTSSTPLGMADHSSLYRLPHEEGLASPGSLSNQKGGGGAFPRVDREVNVIFGGHGSQENRRQQKLYDRQVLVATTSAPAPYRWSEYTITFRQADQ